MTNTGGGTTGGGMFEGNTGPANNAGLAPGSTGSYADSGLGNGNSGDFNWGGLGQNVAGYGAAVGGGLFNALMSGNPLAALKNAFTGGRDAKESVDAWFDNRANGDEEDLENYVRNTLANEGLDSFQGGNTIGGAGTPSGGGFGGGMGGGAAGTSFGSGGSFGGGIGLNPGVVSQGTNPDFDYTGYRGMPGATGGGDGGSSGGGGGAGSKAGYIGKPRYMQN